MELSIVIVNWNTLEMLRDCLQSTFQNLGNVRAEVIVIDNASEDGSPDMVEREFSEAILIRNTENRGFAAANNQGFKIARGKYILLLNSDTIVHGDVLAKSVDYLETHEAAGAMGCRVLNTDGTVQLTCNEFPTLTNQFIMATGLWKLKYPRWFGKYLMTDWQRDSECSVEVVSGCYLMIRHEIINEIGGLDEDFFFYGEETDWCYRIRQAGWVLMFAPVGEITHHGGGSVRKLNYKKDVMLTGAKVRLHKKHGSKFQAFLCWLIAVFFMINRMILWTLIGVVSRSKTAAERARHFRNVFFSLRQVWEDYS